MPAQDEPPIIVGIGASAGGVQALSLMLGAFTLDSAAFVVVMHLPQDRRSLLAQVLGRYTVLEVEAATGGLTLERNHVYVVPESENVALHEGRFVFEGDGRTVRGARNIDHFLTSLASEYGPESIGVVLSGASTDGSAGLAAIRSAGGCTFVQSPASALFAHMPTSAAASADFELEPGALGSRLMALLLSRAAARVAAAAVAQRSPSS